MKNNKGITLTSLVIYIAIIFVVIAALTRVTTYFSNNMKEALSKIIPLTAILLKTLIIN